jgi:glyoxylase-like metal-dependent hydrolase (beta-lactamase superfamily II)
VYVAVRPDVFRTPVEGNISFIVNDSDVVVVDAGGTARSAEIAIQLLRSITDKPVRYIVITHWHGDHNFGVATWQRAFPGVEVIGHANTREVMLSGRDAEITAKNKASIVELRQELAHDLQAGVDMDGKKTLTPERRAQLQGFDADVAAYQAQLEKLEITPPTLTLDQELVLHRGSREIHIIHPGLGNTNGDVAVWLPQEGVLMTGDLLPNPVPYGFGSYPKEWVVSLDVLAKLRPKTLIPGHGDIQHDLGYLRQVQTLLTTVVAQVTAVARAGGSLEQARSALKLGDVAKPFTDTSKKAGAFDDWFIQPIVSMAYKEAKGESIVQGSS